MGVKNEVYVWRGASLGFRFFLGLSPRRGLAFLGASPFGRRPDHGFELHAVGVGKIDRIVIAPIILARRIDDVDAIIFEKSAQRVDIFAAGHFEGVVMKTDIAF